MKKLQNPSLRKRKGFTLIELIVVIAILAILAAIAIPAFTGTLTRAKGNTHNANRKVIMAAGALYEAETGAAATTIDALKSGGYIDGVPANPLDAVDVYTYNAGTVTPDAYPGYSG